MKIQLRAILLTIFLFVTTNPARAADAVANAIVDKAIAAMGGAEKLAKVSAFSLKAKGTVFFNGNENVGTSEAIYKGLDHFRREFANDQFRAVVVVAGDKGWRKLGEDTSAIESNGLANEKRTGYLTVIPITLVPLKGDGFGIAAAGEEKVGDKTAVGVKVTGPDSKTFNLWFDKESGFPVKLVAQVVGLQDQEYTLEIAFSDYKTFGGIKKASKYQSKRNGEKFQEMNVVEFKVLDTVDPAIFSEPK